MSLILSRLIICSLLWNSLVVSQYVNGTSYRMKLKALKLDKELIQDAIAKVRSVEHFKEMNFRTTAYQVGDILCTVRHLLGRVVQLYKQVELNEVSNDELVNKFEEVHNSWYTIENLIRMVEQWEGRESHRRSAFGVDIGGIEESKRWTLLEEGERRENVPLKVDRWGRDGRGTQRKRKRKIWEAGTKDRSETGFK